MSVNVKFFASLREQTGLEEVELASAGSVLDAWQQATGETELPPNTLCAVNMEYSSPQQAIKPGDEVAFFPPVTGG